jgi:hypothetical protein
VGTDEEAIKTARRRLSREFAEVSSADYASGRPPSNVRLSIKQSTRLIEISFGAGVRVIQSIAFASDRKGSRYKVHWQSFRERLSADL